MLGKPFYNEDLVRYGSQDVRSIFFRASCTVGMPHNLVPSSSNLLVNNVDSLCSPPNLSPLVNSN